MPRIFSSKRNAAGLIQAFDRDTKAVVLSYASPSGTNDVADLDVDDTHIFCCCNTVLYKNLKETGAAVTNRTISIGGGNETWKGMCVDNTHLYVVTVNNFTGIIRLYKLLKSNLSTVGSPLVITGSRNSLVIDTNNVYSLRTAVFPQTFIDVYSKATLTAGISFRVDDGVNNATQMGIVNDSEVKIYVTRAGGGQYTRVYRPDGSLISSIVPTSINPAGVSTSKFTPGRIIGGTTKCFYTNYYSALNDEGLAAISLATVGLIGTKFFSNATNVYPSFIYENWYYEEFLNIPTGNVTYVSGGGRSGGAGGKARRRLIKNQSFGDI